MQVQMQPESSAAQSYGCLKAEERYYCNFGLNPSYRQQLQDAGLLVTGWDAGYEAAGEARIIELPHHPFYLATLFVPQAKSSPRFPHPLVRAFLMAAASLQ